jgi:uncharacterized membrane protein SirB2
MTVPGLVKRARHDPLYGHGSGVDRFLGRPVAYLATSLIILALFSWTFVLNPDRVAPTKDPAYYTWRTEALLTEDPVKLLEIEGAFDMFAGGYRVAAPVIAGFLRHVGGVSSLKTTVLLMVAVPVLMAFLLAGFAYQQLRDPLAWHAVAFFSAALFLTPPFVGYLDNVLCLLMLAAALFFLGPSKDSWPARVALFLVLLVAGATHPTTLVIFCLTLGLMAGVRLLLRRFDLRSVLRDDGPMLATAFVAAVTTYAIWTLGIWGKSASLTEAALPPPYDSEFFIARLSQWFTEMNPLLNGPLFLLGALGVAASVRDSGNELGRVSFLWLPPLAGLFGFLAGLTYPYYRFFNTTLAWVLLVGLGAYFAVRFLFEVAGRGGGVAVLAFAGLVAIAGVAAYDFFTGFGSSGWNKPEGGWISADAKTDLDALRSELSAEDAQRPVVFVIDDVPSPQVWGFTKLSGNTSRYGLPPGQIDQGYLYLGSLDNYLAGRPTESDDPTYNRLSPALLEDARQGFQASDEPPVAVVASAFNANGSNAQIAASGNVEVDPGGQELWFVREGRVSKGPGAPAEPAEGAEPSDGGILHLLRVCAGLALLVLPGAIALRWCLPGAGVAEAIGMAPALGVTLLTVTGTIALAVTRSPFSPTLAWVTLAITLVVALGLLGASSVRSPTRVGTRPVRL